MGPSAKYRQENMAKVVKPKRQTKRTTNPGRTHRFQSFTERIANLKIDPIRQRREAGAREELEDDTFTHFGHSLEEWRELNLSHTFSLFVREAAPLSDSLPVVLYNEEKIMDLLMTYIGKGESLSLEPLLNLLSHFAHDLDSRFEGYLERAVMTVAGLAAKHSDPAVVEWSFNCLSWLFKYLSRLLSPDLRPLYNLMSPYLGKETRKPFIIRFAAESLSFLVRKAASRYERDNGPLDTIVAYILEQCEHLGTSATSELQRQGVMTLFTESIKGVQNGLHSTGYAVIGSLIRQVGMKLETPTDELAEIAVGTVTSLIHHTNPETFSHVQSCILDNLNDSRLTGRAMSIDFTGRLIFTIASVRKGERVCDWTPLLTNLQRLLDVGDLSEICETTRWSIVSAIAVVFQAAPLGNILSHLDCLDKISSGSWSQSFLSFCDLFSRLGHERFCSLLQSPLQRYILDQNDIDKFEFFTMMCHLARQGIDVQFELSKKLQNAILEYLLPVETGNETLHLERANIALKSLRNFRIKAPEIDSIHKRLFQLVDLTLQDNDNKSTQRDDFAMGPCLTELLTNSSNDEMLLNMWPSITAQCWKYLTLPDFWSNVLVYLQRFDSSVMRERNPSFEDALVRCLALPSREIRKNGLQILQNIWRSRSPRISDAAIVAMSIEAAPISLESSRTISVNIRKLTQTFSAAIEDELLQKLIPTYCFGILNFHLSPAWDDALSGLSEMAKSSSGEEVIIKLVQMWLEEDPDHENSDDSSTHEFLDTRSNLREFRVLSDFACTNLSKLSAISAQVSEPLRRDRTASNSQSLYSNRRVSHVSPNAREQSLKILNRIPSLAEKRSRMLVPVLLRWVGSDETEDDFPTSPSRWSRKNKKSMLYIFAQFNNPRVLYRSEKVYSALLSLCANGDPEIQSSALKAILAWKEDGIKRYEEHLKNLLDESRFRDEISVFLQGGDEEGITIREEDHPKLMPLLLRVLYGRAIAGGKQGQDSRRKAIFVALSRFGDDVIQGFVDIILSSGKSLLTDATDSVPRKSFRHKLGMLNMVHDLLETLGSVLEPCALRLLDAIVDPTVEASRDWERGTAEDEAQGLSLLRSVRQAGMQSLVQLFSRFPDTDFTITLEAIEDSLVKPRLQNFAVENTQSISVLLRLTAAWSVSQKNAKYVTYYGDTLVEQIGKLLSNTSTKDEVRLFVLREIIDRLLTNDANPAGHSIPSTGLIRNIGGVLKQQPSKEILDACVASFARLSDDIEGEADAKDVLEVSTTLLAMRNREVSQVTKSTILRAIIPLVQKFSTSLPSSLFRVLCGLFSRMQDGINRVLLSSTVVAVCESDASLSHIAQICKDLNALGTLEQPDHSKREHAFITIFDEYSSFSPQMWQPVVHNCLFFIRDAEDLVNRSSASRALQRFAETARENPDQYESMITNTLLPGIELGMKDSSELVRAEFLQLLCRLVLMLPDLASLQDLKVLTSETDDENSFFTDLLHIQQNRRLQALRQLSSRAKDIGSNNVSRILLPALEHFVFDAASGDGGRTLADQTVMTIGAVSQSLSWQAFRATFSRYTGYLKTKEGLEKFVLRLLGTLVDALTPSSSIDTARSAIITRDFLPPLVEYIHRKDESTVDRRLPVAITIVKLLTILPTHEMSVRLGPVLTDVCQILRSRSVEARDQTRKTLSAILSIIGPAYFGFVLKELRSALQHGYQLHVLSFTVHSVLVHLLDKMETGSLDYCLPDLILVIMDDVFGVTGQEKDAEEYKSNMKEIKAAKSFDTMELLARVIPISRLGQLIHPLRSLLLERLDSNALRKVEDLLRRVRKGIDQNSAADSRDTLVFCYEIARLMYSEQKLQSSGQTHMDRRISKYIPPKTATGGPKSGPKNGASPTSQQYKLVCFALDLLSKVLRRHDDLMIPANISGFLPIIGDALLQSQEDVRTSAMKFLSVIMKLQIAELDNNSLVYVKEAVGIITASPSVNSNSAKAALELMTAVLREKRSVEIKERDIAVVVKALKGDIDEPDRQGMTYSFLRAVLGRKVVTTEVYEIMDDVRDALVTNPDRGIRESARSAYLQFVMDYPQGKDRWNKQTAFMVENLKYKHPAGRESVMELLHQLLSKLGDEVVEQVSLAFFLALVPVQVNDAEVSCRQMATVLIAQLFKSADEDKLKGYLSLMQRWLQNSENDMIRAAALQCWQSLLRTRIPSTEFVEALRNELESIIAASSTQEPDDQNVVIENGVETFSVLTETVPDIAFAKNSRKIWEDLGKCVLLLPLKSAIIAAQLQEVYLSDFARSNSKTESGLAAQSLQGSRGLRLDSDQMRLICQLNLRALQKNTREIDEVMAGQLARNLVFVGRCFGASEITWRDDDHDTDSEEDKSQIMDRSALGHLFNRLSYIIRQDKFSVNSRAAALQCQTSLAKQIAEIPQLVSVLRSLRLLAELPDARGPNEALRNLKDGAREFLDAIQKKVGVEPYLKALAAVRSQQEGRREERRQKRRIDAVSAPERLAKQKQRKYEKNKARSKGKGQEQRGRRRGW